LLLGEYDDWFDTEADYLRQELEEMADAVDRQAEDAARARREVRRLQEEGIPENINLANKLCACTRLVDELERIMQHYIDLTGTNLVTSKLLTLRKNGGFI
jgi:hypothetical protein